MFRSKRDPQSRKTSEHRRKGGKTAPLRPVSIPTYFFFGEVRRSVTVVFGRRCASRAGTYRPVRASRTFPCDLEPPERLAKRTSSYGTKLEASGRADADDPVEASFAGAR